MRQLASKLRPDGKHLCCGRTYLATGMVARPDQLHHQIQDGAQHQAVHAAVLLAAQL